MKKKNKEINKIKLKIKLRVGLILNFVFFCDVTPSSMTYVIVAILPILASINHTFLAHVYTMKKKENEK